MTDLRRENIDIEYKLMYTSTICKDVIAFANTEGGTIFVGVHNTGEVAGVEDPDDTMLRISSSLRDNIRPDIIPFIQIRSGNIERKNVIRITVSAGTGRPYYLADKGLKPSGVYVRTGSAAVPLSEEGIRKMIAESYGESFENRRSLEQDLTFRTFNNEMISRDIDISSDEKRKNLNLIDESGLYTNLALLLSDQCPVTIKAAVFNGTTKEHFQDRREFTGSVFDQIRNANEFIELLNRTRASVHGLLREDIRDYPEEAIREALLNMVVHRYYALSGSSIINVYDDRMEFISLGGLVDGLSMEAVFMGASLSRNPHMAALFYKMKLIESYGTGIPKIEALYKNCVKKPEFSSATGAFKAVLYNRNAFNEPHRLNDTEIPYDLTANSDSIRPAVSSYSMNKQIIMNEIATAGEITRKRAQELLGVGQTAAYNTLNRMVNDGLLKIIRAGRKTVYR